MTKPMDFALQYAARGIPVFPCNGKYPLTAHGFYDATVDPAQIRLWQEQYPNANISIRTGSASRLLVLDIDDRHGGSKSLQVLEEEYGTLPETCEARTGTGGRHLYFVLAEGQIIPSSTGKLAPGLDIRAEGGYIVAYPSIHPDTQQQYVWVNGLKPASLPAWFAELLIKLSQMHPAVPSQPDAPIPEGQRNATLTKIAGAMRRQGCPQETIELALLDINAKRVRPVLPEREVRTIARSIARYPPVQKESPGNGPSVPQVEVHEQPVEAKAVDPKQLTIPDMPDSVLDGRLGEICRRQLKDFPIAYAWPALLASLSALMHPQVSPAIRANLYVCLVGPVHSGKSTCIDRANFLLDVKDPVLRELKSGSAEGLLKDIGEQHGQGILFSPDELAHLFEKMDIQNASFASVLSTLFYKNTQDLTIARGQKVRFDARLSIIGGIVDEKFEDAFGTATTIGLYDRFLFGQCPMPYEYAYRPLDGGAAFTDYVDEVPVDREVWEARDDLAKAEKMNPRVLEIVLRGARNCAAFDGRPRLLATELAPAWELARYQIRLRALLQPNRGKTLEAQFGLKLLHFLERHAPRGEWVEQRQALRRIHAAEYGENLADRTVNAMKFAGIIERQEVKTPAGRLKRYIRLAVEQE